MATKLNSVIAVTSGVAKSAPSQPQGATRWKCHITSGHEISQAYMLTSARTNDARRNF